MFISTYAVTKSLCADLGIQSSDVQYLFRRLKNEGNKFITSTLPKLWKCVAWSLNLGYFDRANESFSLTCFAWKGRSLRYFRSLLDRLFDPKTGYAVNYDREAASTAVFRLRMLCEYLYKLCVPFDQDTLLNAEGRYASFEANYPRGLVPSEHCQYLEDMRWALCRFYPAIARASVDDILSEHHPRYGPGSLNLNDLRSYGGDRFPYWEYKNLPVRTTGLAPRRLGAVSGFLKPYPAYRLGPKDQVWKPEVSRMCEILFVPKNADGPRVISRENPFDIRLQMAYFDWSSRLYEKVTGGHVQFRDQTVNREIARIGSLTGRKITADLESASDRIAARDARYVFQNCPGVMWFFRNARSTHAHLPSGDVLLLKKLAGMGSGLTFPTMAMMIYLAACVGVIRGRYPGINHIRNVPRIASLWREISETIDVYGDDFACNTDDYPGAFYGIEAIGLKINRKKTFVAGPFRESCGGDYFLGQDVTPVRLKLMNAGCELISNVNNHGIKLRGGSTTYVLERHCRELVSKGLVTLADYYYSRLERVYGSLPYVGGQSPYLGRYVVGNVPAQTSRKAWLPAPVTETFELMDQQTALGRSLRPQSGELYSSDTVQPYGVLAVPHKVKLKKRLVTTTDLSGNTKAAIHLRSAKSWLLGESVLIERTNLFAENFVYLTNRAIPDGLALCLSYAMS